MLEWQKHWGSAHYCSYCQKLACSDIKFCQYCDNVAHRLCITEYSKKHKHMYRDSYRTNNKEVDKYIKMHLSLPVDRFVCLVCEQSREEDKQYIDKMKEKVRLEKIRMFYARLIARKMLMFWRRKVYKRQRAAHLMLQAFVRRRMAGREYGTRQREARRVLIIEVEQLPKYVMDNPTKHLVILTIIDPIKHSQLFRFDKKIEVVKNEG
jgi:hypothetical protein